MSNAQGVIEYKCPCCGAGLIFGNDIQKMSCQYCDNSFDVEAVKAFNESLDHTDSAEFQWEQTQRSRWDESEQASMRVYTCPSCGGELIADENTAATFCPYCENPTILESRLSGGIKPDAVIPFKTSKEDAKEAFLRMCKGKRLLPKMFTQQHRIEKISGIYVPFWLYDCAGDFSGTYNATRVHSWSDSNFVYTKTDHFLLSRQSSAGFARIPMDASSKLDNTIMESIEPYDYQEMIDFDTAYLSGYLADKYDVESEAGQQRVQQRVEESINEMLQSTFRGYATVVPKTKQLNVTHGSAKYVLLPVWMLHTQFNGKTYVFAMNGQTGKMTGTLPTCPKRTAAWFAGVCAATTAVVALLEFLLL